MYQLKSLTRFVIHTALCTSTMIWIALGIGCAPKNLPTYHASLIEKHSHEQPRPLWQYPATSVLREAEGSAGLNGVVRRERVPGYLNFMQDVEPPFIIGMHVLADGSLVCISPMELQQEFKKFVFANYCRETFTRVKIILLNNGDGTERWSRIISAGGLYDIKEINSTLLFHSREFDKDGKFVEAQLVALEKERGDILWQRNFTQPFRHFSIAQEHNLIVFYTESSGDSAGSRAVEAVDVSTGKPRWTFVVKDPESKSNHKGAWPILFPDGIMLFDEGVTYCRLPDGKVLWEREDLYAEGIAQPEAADRTVYMQSKDGLVSLDVNSGKTMWTCAAVKDDVTKLAYTGKHVCVVESKKGLFSKTCTLFVADPATGAILWRYKTEPILGNIVESESAVFFSIKDRIIALDVKNGAELYKGKLPWEEEFSPHKVLLRGHSVIVGNEWNVAMWDQKDGKIVYHHHFEPLCPIMTTEERMREQKALGGQASAMTAGAFSYSSAVNTADYTSKYHQSMANYRSTGDSLHLNDAQMYYGMTRASMGMERTMAGMQFGMALSQATMSIGMSIIKTKIKTVHSMVYPAIDSMIQSFRAFDNAEYVVRLVGMEDGSQRFAAIEILHVSTGKRKQILLSPYQMPSDLKTMGSSKMFAHELNGYLPVATYQHHAFSTVVDLQRERIYHYGPGLNAEDYFYFGKSGFIRGVLWAFPLSLPAGH